MKGILLLLALAGPVASVPADETSPETVQDEIVALTERTMRAKLDLPRLEQREDVARAKRLSAERRLKAAYAKAEANFAAEHAAHAARGAQSTDEPLDRAACRTRSGGAPGGDPPDVRVKGVHVKTSWRKALVGAKTEIENAGPEPADVAVRQFVTEAGRIRFAFPAAKTRIASGETVTVTRGGRWADPKPWGIGGDYGEPHLYELVTDIWRNGCRVDRYVQAFGFREFWLFHTDFFLNGRRIVLRDAAAGADGPIAKRRDGVNVLRAPDGACWSERAACEADRIGLFLGVQTNSVAGERTFNRLRNHPCVIDGRALAFVPFGRSRAPRSGDGEARRAPPAAAGGDSDRRDREDVSAEIRRRDRIRREADELEAKCNALRESLRQSLEAAETLTVTAELMEGVRKFPPVEREHLSEIRVFEPGLAKVIERKPGDGPTCVRRAMLLEGGRRYRFVAEVKAEGVTGADVAFGLEASGPSGETLGSSAAVGSGTFDWRSVSFDFVLPFGATDTRLHYGLEGGSGRVEFRDVTVYDVARTLE